MKQQQESRPAGGENGVAEPGGTEGGEIRQPPGSHDAAGWPLKVVVLVILLVVGAAAGLLTFLGQIQPVGAPPPKAERYRIAIPRPGSLAAAPAEPDVQTVVVKSKPIALPVPPQPPSQAPQKDAPSPPAPATAEIAPRPVSAPATIPTPAAASAPAKGIPPAFVLEAGPFVTPAQLARAEKTLRRLGFNPVRKAVHQTISATRLRVGEYPPAEAETRLAELSSVAPGAFSLPRGDKVAVYAATYYDIDKARSHADQLFGKGIRLEEEPAQVSLTVQRLRFGAFSDRTSAARAAARAGEAGLDTTVVDLR